MDRSDSRESTAGDILIVDDTLPNLRLLSDMLKEQGYAVRGASNGPVALMMCRAELPDLILLDIRMPDVDGYQVCQQLKADAHLRDIPVIFMSALDDVQAKVEGFAVGGVDYITKPFHSQEVLARVATHIAIRRLQRRLQAQQVDIENAAAAAERERLARELHDAVTQTLFSASAIAETLPQVWERYPEEGRRGLEELRQLTRGALAEMRTLLVELRPAALTEKSLDALLGHLTEAMAKRTRIPVTFAAQVGRLLPPDVQVVLYRVAQEALNNVAKHAQASQAWVELHCEPEKVLLCVRDDGVGFNPQDVQPDHFGLGIMRERATGIGATLEITSRPGAGTEVVVEWQDREEREQ